MYTERGRSRSLFLVSGTVSGALLLGAVIAVIAIVRRVDVAEVRGGSMAPALLAGDRLLVVALRRPPRVGDVVLAPDPRDPSRELVKRVVSARGGAVAVRGDAPYASTDSRTFGTLPAAAVRWRAAFRYWPPRRIGPIPPARPVAAAAEEGGEGACAFPGALLAGDPG